MFSPSSVRKSASGPLKIPFKTIQSATNNFSDANLIRESASRKSHKGKIELSGQLVDIVAEKQTETTFLIEVSLLSRLKHKNLVSMVGFCHEKGEKTMENIIIYKNDQGKGSLDKYLTNSDLNWMQRLHICVGVARALKYIYYKDGRGISVIHRDIRSSKILLDDNWKPRLSGFEHSINHPAYRRDGVFNVKFCGTRGYCDPLLSNKGMVSHKSDIYSLGVVLFEVLCGKTAVQADDMLLTTLVKSHRKGETLRDVIDPDLYKSIDSQSLKTFTELAYQCLKDKPSQRPNIHHIVKKLNEVLKSQQQHDDAAKIEDAASKYLKGKTFEHMKIPLSDILEATNNFKIHRIAEGSFGEVYEAKLEHVDRKNLLSVEEKNLGELPKKRSRVAIKRILNRKDNAGVVGFYKEIEMLTHCDHPNIVHLIGFCKEDAHMILVYEYASKGSLDYYLKGNGNMRNLSWVQRIQVCIDIAHGLNYLHSKDKGRIIHRDIKSGNVLLNKNYVAKIGDFGLSVLRPEENQHVNKTIHTESLVGTEGFMDPEFRDKGKMKNEMDIYSFGVILLEMLSGRFANDAEYTKEHRDGIAHVARRRFAEGSIKEMVDYRLMEETHENIYARDKGPDQNSLDEFIKITYECVKETQAKRPSLAYIVDSLKNALTFQEKHMDRLQMSFEDIERATNGFSDEIRKERGGKVYKGCHGNVPADMIAAKNMGPHSDEKEQNFWLQVRILLEYEHENIIGLVGYCNDVRGKVIAYEYASRGSLDRYLKDKDLTWTKRLEICIGITSGLEVLHGGAGKKEVVLHRQIKCSNILLNDDWIPKITDFGSSYRSLISNDIESVINKISGQISFLDTENHSYNYSSTKYFDMYSLGLVLFEILYGRLWDEYSGIERIKYLSRLSLLAKDGMKIGEHSHTVFEGIEKQIAPRSLARFQSAALKCIDHNRVVQSPSELLVELKEALELQKDYDTWKPKLPDDYEQIFKWSNSQEVYSNKTYKDLYGMLSKGIPLQEDKVLFLLGGNGDRNVMISAKYFSSIDGCLHKWQHVPESRFAEVAKMLDILNLNLNLKLKIKTITQLLSPNVDYGVYLVFKCCDGRQVSSKPLYVNLKYRDQSKSQTDTSQSHAYFATRRDKEWMMIELCRFLNDKDDIAFEFLLESFSPFYCGDSTIYVEGIEFRAINTNGKHEKNKEIKKSDSDMVQQMPNNPEERLTINGNGSEKLFWLHEVNGKKHLKLSAKAALNNYSNVKCFKTTPSTQSRFGEVIELLQEQVFCINCMIGSEMLSRDTDYVCYLVFKLSEECHGLQYPVRVRDLLHWTDEEAEILYFRSPRPWNLHDPNQAPKHRADGWMEAKVWKFNLNQEFKDEHFHIHLRLVSYEGTLSGLIVCGLEFRPM